MLRLRQIALVAQDLDAVVDQFRTHLGIEVAFNDPSVATFGLRNAVMPLGNQFVEVVSPTREGTAGGRYLERRAGDGGYMVILQADQHAERRQRIVDLGVRRVLEHQSEHYTIMQLHPADTGGSFLEIDDQRGGEDMATGPWEPAGPDWQRARRTDVVTAIAAAEIQSPDPARLAARWSEILDVPVEETDSRLEVPLDNATLRFVEATDGRGEGLGGLDLVSAGEVPENVPSTLGGVRITLLEPN
jgi:hypothetical protein